MRTAYVSKELAAQLAEKEARRLEIKLQERHEKKKLEESLASLEETHKALLKEEFTKKTVYRQELQDQMIINEKRKRFLYDEFLREKKMIDDIVERIYAEDEREKLEKMCKMQRTKEEMDAFKRAQQLWRDKQREEIVKENERMQEFIMKKAIEMENREAKKNEMEAIKTKLTETIAQQLYEGEVCICLFWAPIYILPIRCVNVVINVYTACLEGKHCPNTSNIMGCFKTVVL